MSETVQTPSNPPIAQFYAENYRGFAERITIELRPLTLVFGYNNAGKSSILRFLPLLCESLEAGRSPLLLEGEVLAGAGFTNVVCRHTRSRKLSFGVALDDGSSLDVVVRGEQRAHEVEDLRYTDSQGSAQRWRAGEPGRFRAYLPIDGSWGPALADHDAALRGVQWLRGLRGTPARWRNLPAGLGHRILSDGSDAGDWLALEGNRSGIPDPDSLGGAVDRYFQGLGLRLSVEERNEQYTLNLDGRGADANPIPLVDSGEGYLQVLPVLVAAERAARGGPKVVAAEQPELHLHTRAQRVLGEWLAAQAAAGEARIVVETHSEVLLTAVQLAVALGTLAPERVGVYWVRREDPGISRVDRIEMGADGRLSGPWPLDVFGDLSALTRALYDARRGRIAG